MNSTSPLAPPAQVTLRAHPPAPARVELVPRPLPGRLARTVLSLVILWGAIPLLVWVPPHYPWVVGAVVAGSYLAYRNWTGRYYVVAFAGLCPRCGHPLSLGLERSISLPHPLTCYHCHFEPLLEVRIPGGAVAEPRPRLGHHTPDCFGSWTLRWLADEPVLVCDHCFASAPPTAENRRAADAENDHGAMLARLTREGGPLL